MKIMIALNDYEFIFEIKSYLRGTRKTGTGVLNLIGASSILDYYFLIIILIILVYNFY